MKPAPRRRDIASVIGVPLTIAIVLGAQLLERGAAIAPALVLRTDHQPHDKEAVALGRGVVHRKADRLLAGVDRQREQAQVRQLAG